jgi:hypothetical protein
MRETCSWMTPRTQHAPGGLEAIVLCDLESSERQCQLKNRATCEVMQKLRTRELNS